MFNRNKIRRTIGVAILAILTTLGVGVLSASTAQAGPQCSITWLYCGSARNASMEVDSRPNYNMGIGILYNAWSNYPYDAVLYPGQHSTIYAADIDKVYAGSGWCVDVVGSVNSGVGLMYSVRGPGWSPNIADVYSEYRLYAYPCGGSW